MNIKHRMTVQTTKIKLLQLVDRSYLKVVNTQNCDVDVTTHVCYERIVMMVLLYLRCLGLESENGRPPLSETSEIQSTGQE